MVKTFDYQSSFQMVDWLSLDYSKSIIFWSQLLYGIQKSEHSTPGYISTIQKQDLASFWMFTLYVLA
jgi:hypothetical protein